MTQDNMPFMVGVVIICPNTNNQIAIHKNFLKFLYWNAELAGHEADIIVEKCGACNQKHSITIPLDSR